jgi:fengycin family lipopeptide synthetase D
LSNVKAILNGAEPISVELMNRFVRKLSPYGFSPNAMMPVYGLAEASLAVSFTELSKLPTTVSFDRAALHLENNAVCVSDSKIKSVTIVSVGKVLKNCEVRIVDENNLPLEDGKVGHIQIKGENVSIGYLYFDKKDYFVDNWFKTGDMGFIIDEELFVTGRYKDIIFLNGQNFYASDLENIAQQVEGVIEGKVFICGVHDEKSEMETPLLFLSGFEINKSIGIFIRISKLIRSVTGIDIKTFVLLRSNQIPKTTSGKIQRHKLISQYLEGEFDEIISRINELIQKVESEFLKDKALPTSTSEQLLHKLWCHFLSRHPHEIGIDDTFYEAGGNSLGAVEMLMELEKNYNIKLDYSIIVENRTIRKLAVYIDKHPTVYQISSSRKTRFGG